jgi:hypothetical protein
MLLPSFCSRMRLLNVLALLVCVPALGVRPGAAQDLDSISADLGMEAFFDYFFVARTSDPDLDEFNGFTYRRFNLSADFDISNEFTARARVEAQGNAPNLFVKDLWLRWTSRYGHGLAAGILPTPPIEIAERVWPFRSLLETLLELNGIIDSRDMGLRADGPIGRGGFVRYAAMVGNDNFVLGEDDREKRIYVNLNAFLSDFIVSFGLDYASAEASDGLIRYSGLAGFNNGPFQAGVEAFTLRNQGADQSFEVNGASVFAAFWPLEDWAIVGRYDRTGGDVPAGWIENFAVAAIVYQPLRAVRIMPNALIQFRDGEEAFVIGRVTLELQM